MRDIFLPYQGEFGCYITTFVRVVHTWPNPEKIVVCPHDHRCLFPTAQSFIHDYPDLLPDKKKRGRSCRPWVTTQLEAMQQTIRSRLPGHEDCNFVLPFMKLNCYQSPEIVQSRFTPAIARRGLRIDVAITPRCREYDRRRNWPFWQEIVDGLKCHGYTVGSVGRRETSQPLERVDLRSWEYGGLEATVAILSNAKLVLAQNTGTAHFSVFLERPTIVMTTSTGMLCWMEVQRNRSVYFQLVNPNPDAALSAAIDFLTKCGSF